MQKLILAIALVPAFASAMECAEPTQPINGNDSPNKKYFEELFRRGAKAPLEDFLKL